MKRLVLVALMFCSNFVLAESPPMSAAEQEKIRLIVREVLREYTASMNAAQGHGHADQVVVDIRTANSAFMQRRGPGYFKPFLDGQHPRATVVTCSDSRVHTHALDASPDNDLFMIRDIGNQIATAEGSVEYGVHHLHTPLLLIVGHSACGAIKAASGDYSGESPAIRRELDTIQIPKGEPGMSSIKLNVHNQVKLAMSKFEKEILSGHLTVVGAVYDFRNDMKLGQGRLNVVNVNGESDPAKIAGLPMMKEASRPPMRRAMVKKPAPKSEESEENSAPADEHAAKNPSH